MESLKIATLWMLSASQRAPRLTRRKTENAKMEEALYRLLMKKTMKVLFQLEKQIPDITLENMMIAAGVRTTLSIVMSEIN